jgi:serine-type D-Ala-D-Ala carboxypeptidase/endopeptidase (penicillin-binding protein 4)
MIFRFSLTAFLVFLTLNLSAQDSLTNVIQQSIDVFCQSPHLKSAAVTIEVRDASTNKTLAAKNPHLAISPASTTKLFSTATAYELLGSTHRPVTRIYYSGEIDSAGTLHGNLIVRGGGDASLGSRYFTEEGNEHAWLAEWVGHVKELGIKKIDGFVLADASDFGYDGVPDGWTWSDMGNYYGAAPSGLVVFDNMTNLYFQTSAHVGDSAWLECIDPYVPDWRITNRVVGAQIKGDQAYVYGAPFSMDWYVKGQIPYNQSNFKVKAAIPDPEKQVALVFHAALMQAGIPVAYRPQTLRLQVHIKKELYAQSKLIVEIPGKDVNALAHWVNQRSVNLFAEQLLCWMGFKRYGMGATSNGIAAVLEFWKGKIDLSSIRLTDGSGLSRSNQISAAHFCDLLHYMHQKGNKDFEKTLPIAGKTGTLSGVCRNQSGQGRIKAKSGTMNRVRSYAGYVDTKSGKKLVFSVSVNNHTNSSEDLLKMLEKVFNVMAEY